MTHPVIGALTPDPFSVFVESPFDHFDIGIVHGLARVMEDGDRLELLALASRDEGRGYVGRFLAECCANYATVRVLEVHNRRLLSMLVRRDFVPGAWWIEGEKIDGMEWTR